MNVENEIINKIRINKENYHFVNKELKKKILSFGMTLSIIFTSIGVNYFYNKPKEKEKEYSINMSVYDVSERKERRYIYVSDQLQEGIYAVIDV